MASSVVVASSPPLQYSFSLRNSSDSVVAIRSVYLRRRPQLRSLLIYLLFLFFSHVILFLSLSSPACMVRLFHVCYWSFFLHLHTSAWKQAERKGKIDTLPATYSEPLSLSEQTIHSLSISQLVSQCQAGKIAPSAIMMAYAKKTLAAHKETNCLSDVMFDEALLIPSVANWGPGLDSDAGINDVVRERSLMGVPVSIKGLCLFFSITGGT